MSDADEAERQRKEREAKKRAEYVEAARWESARRDKRESANGKTLEDY